jgi:hypothetical protein
MKNLVILVVFLSFALNVFSQAAKKPTIMVVPSDVWCNKNSHMQEFENQGKKSKVPDYRKALMEDADLLLVMSKINELYVERGFPLKNLESELKNLERKSARKNQSSVQTNPLTELSKVAKADIWIQLTWTVNTQGPKKSITFNLQGLDAYTNKQIAGASGTGQPSFTAELPVLLEEAVLSHIDNFNSQLQKHFDDLFANGREVGLEVYLAESFESDLETDQFGGTQLSKQIKKWVKDNTVQGRFGQKYADELSMEFDQVRIPLFDANGDALDAQTWAEGLQTFLTGIGVKCSVKMEGLGYAMVELTN